MDFTPSRFTTHALRNYDLIFNALGRAEPQPQQHKAHYDMPIIRLWNMFTTILPTLAERIRPLFLYAASSRRLAPCRNETLANQRTHTKVL